MTCAHCENLREEIAWLKGELGMMAHAGRIDALCRAFRIAPGAAKTLARLYAASGRPVESWRLMEATADHATDDARVTNNVSVMIHRIRQALGRSAIHTSWGRGYSLTPEGMARVAAILEPQEIAA